VSEPTGAFATLSHGHTEITMWSSGEFDLTVRDRDGRVLFDLTDREQTDGYHELQLWRRGGLIRKEWGTRIRRTP